MALLGAPVKLARNSAAAESEGGQKFLPLNPLPFCPPERSVLVLPREARQSKFAVRIFVKKNSDFNQKAPPFISLGLSLGLILGILLYWIYGAEKTWKKKYTKYPALKRKLLCYSSHWDYAEIKMARAAESSGKTARRRYYYCGLEKVRAILFKSQVLKWWQKSLKR